MALCPHQQEVSCVPSDAWLFCAACGPLPEQLACLAGMPLEGEPELRGDARCGYRVTQPLPFPELRRLVAARPAVQRAMARAESVRGREGGSRRSLGCCEQAAAARAALLLGREKAFKLLHRDFSSAGSGPAFDSEYREFWDAVLGPGWQGSEAVPAGEARAQIERMTADAFAFFPYPPGAARGGGHSASPQGEDYVAAAAALRSAAAAQPDGKDFSARAAQALLRGRADEAQHLFESLFGRSELGCYLLRVKHGMPLLVYALVNAIRIGGHALYVRAWLSAARELTEGVFSDSMRQEQQELVHFIDNLEMVDHLVNRRGTFMQEPSLSGALSRLPFALLYGALPSYVRQGMPAGELAEAVQTLAQQQLPLLARWGALGLAMAEGLTEAQRAAMETLQQGHEEEGPSLPTPSTECALAALSAVARKQARSGSTLSQSLYAMPPLMVASRAACGAVVLCREDEEEAFAEYEETPALRCAQRYADEGRLVLEGASAAEYTRLFVSLQNQLEVLGSLALPGEELLPEEPEAVVFLSHEGGGSFYASMRLRLLRGASPLFTASLGLDVPVLETPEGREVAVQRHMEGEWRIVERLARRMTRAGLDYAEGLMQGVVPLHGFAELATLLNCCRKLGVECCWERGYGLTLHQQRGKLRLRRGKGEGKWLELGGGLPVDEGRVLALSDLLAAFAGREEGVLPLGNGEYVLLTAELERRLALLELICHERKGRQEVAASAIPLLEMVEGVSPAASAAEDELPPPAGLLATLRPYQQEGFRWLAERAQMGLGALLADDMGLGKTVQVLALLLHAAEQVGAGGSLVVAPVSLLGNWAEEAARFAPLLRVQVYDPKQPLKPGELAAGTLVLASYGQLASRLKEFAAVRWDVLVLDEAQAVKNPDSQRAKAVCALQARARFCLTGTPIENSLLDMWSQMRFLNPGLLGTRAGFQKRFRKAKAPELVLLRQALAPLVLRRTKAEVLTQLPPLTETVEWVEFSKEERALYESLRRAALSKVGEEEGHISILAELTRLRRACCHGKLVLPEYAGTSAKLVALVERVEDLRAAGRHALIFSQFTDVLDLAQDALCAAGISYVRLDGSTPAARRQAAVRQFQQGEADAFLISLKAGGAGLNLTAADYVILLDPWWNPAVEAQAAGRSHRMGQQQPVTLCRFMVRGSVEERIAEMHREKQELAEQVLSGRVEGLSLNNLRALLSS